jgi:hypothetical protein
MGGLGNQMFQYAAGLVLASKNRAPLHLDHTFLLDKSGGGLLQRDYALDVFPCTRVAADQERARGLDLTCDGEDICYDPAVWRCRQDHC